MPKSFKLTSIIILFLSILFIAFFFISKQNPKFSNLNPFAEDPYDAVGSFTIQLSFFTALLSLLRAFRPYNKINSQPNQRVLLLRGLFISALAVLITLITDMIAMIKYYSTWIHLSAGHLLALLVAGMTFFALVTMWLITRISGEKIIISSHRLKRIIVFLLSYSMIFSVYPSYWRQNIYGEIFTVAIGLLLSFLLIWIIANSFFPLAPNASFEDSIDDLSASATWVTRRVKFLKSISLLLDRLLNSFGIRTFTIWLNPRLHKWNLAILVTSIMAISLTVSQTLGEGITMGSPNFVIIVIIFLSFESGAVLLGYRLFADYLGIFRRES